MREQKYCPKCYLELSAIGDKRYNCFACREEFDNNNSLNHSQLEIRMKELMEVSNEHKNMPGHRVSSRYLCMG